MNSTDKLLKQVLAELRILNSETRKTRQVILSWQNQDKHYHNKTLKKMDKKSTPK